MFKMFVGVAGAFLVPATSVAAQDAPEMSMAQPAPVSDPKLVEANNYPLLALPAATDALAALAKDAGWQRVSEARNARIMRDLNLCAQDALCKISAVRWTDAEITSAIAAAQTALKTSKHSARLADAIRGSAAFARYHAYDDRALLAQIWQDMAQADNRILDIHGLGQAPLYPKIDSISFDPKSKIWGSLVNEAINLLLAEPASTQAPSNDLAHRLALQLLYLNERENSGTFADLDSHHNAAARQAVATTDWSAFPYSLILILGDGPDRPGQSIGSFGLLRLQQAVKLYRSGRAPFLVVSGGNVHPARTPFNEALAMKRELMTRYAIPEQAIIIEPHARHTTTNFRNTARLMTRYAIPLDKPALATTSSSHSKYAIGADFDRKAMDEISFIPRTVIERISPYEFCWRANPLSTHRDARDPLDP